jgi:hypothetical protein
VRGVLAAVVAVLAHLQPLGRLLLVLGRGVIAVLAIGALKDDVVTQWLLPFLMTGRPRPQPAYLFDVAS